MPNTKCRKERRVLFACRDCVVFAAHCQKLDGRRVAVKVYEKSKLSASKLRAVKREAAMMIYMTRKRFCNIFYWSFAHAGLTLYLPATLKS
jgi:hypothetical protein